MKHMVMAIADRKEWMKRASQCYKRSRLQKRAEYREDNATRAQAYISMLQIIGVSVKYCEDGITLEFIEPDKYRFVQLDAMEQIEVQREIIRSITEKRKYDP